MTSKKSNDVPVEIRALDIASVILVRAGVCRYDSIDKCRRLERDRKSVV